jgi:hypothetical protein
VVPLPYGKGRKPCEHQQGVTKVEFMAKHPAAFINAIADEGTKAEAIQYLQETWDELCDANLKIKKLEAEIESLHEDAAGASL